MLRATWVYGENVTEVDISEVGVRLSTVGDEMTRLELDHTAVVPDDRWAEYVERPRVDATDSTQRELVAPSPNFRTTWHHSRPPRTCRAASPP